MKYFMPLSIAVLLSACGQFSYQPPPAETNVYKPKKVLPYVVNVAAPMAKLSSSIDPQSVKSAANLVANWQQNHMHEFAASKLVNFQGLQRYSFGGWLMGTMAIGMTEWGKIKGNGAYLDFIRQQSRQFSWGLEQRVFDADDYVIGQTYLELYELDHNPVYLTPLKQRLNYLYENWPTVHKSFGNECERMINSCRERWTWIDALFMGAPVWIHMAKVTGDKRYLEYADREFWASFDTFWDPEESLLYRDIRFKTMRDKHGSKVFWGRGNGWVFAALARIIPNLPEDHPNKVKYVEKYHAMASRLAELQQPDGSWTSSLTNPTLYRSPENSGSAFFTYALAWGLNQGLLDQQTYRPIIEKAWTSLVNSIYADGRLAYVQSSGSGPETTHKESTDVYGVGAFLLAASQVYTLADNDS